MDLFVQIGVLLLMLTMLSLIFYFGSDTFDRGNKISKQLAQEEVSYSMDSTITTSTFYIDSRAFVQWALTTKEQRAVYLMYQGSVTPDEKLYGAYMYELNVTKEKIDQSNRSLVIKPKTKTQISNAILVEDQSPKITNILREFASEAKKGSAKKVVTVYTFTESKTGEVKYLCYIEGVM